MQDAESTPKQFVVDENGEKIAVILPIEEYEDLLDEAYATKNLQDWKSEPTVSHEIAMELIDGEYSEDQLDQEFNKAAQKHSRTV